MRRTEWEREQVPRKILKCLEEAMGDLSIEEIAKVISVHRNTVSKYVYGLEQGGAIVMTRVVGRAKFYTTRERAKRGE